MLSSIPYNLRRLTQFSGRESHAMFWPYVGFLYLATTAITILAVIPTMIGMFGRMQRFAIAHPDQVNVVTGPGSYQMTIEGDHPELMPDFSGFVFWSGVSATIFVLFLAAAVARRLHDRDRSGWWGALPLPFLYAGFAIMSRMFATFGRGAPDFTWFFAGFGVNLVYLATLIYLIVVLAGAGTPGENRFGDTVAITP